MMNPYRPALIALCVLLGFALIERTFSPSTPPQQQHAEHQRGAGSSHETQPQGVPLPPEAERHAAEKEHRAQKDAEDRAALEAYESTAHATWWLVGATFLLVVVGVGVGAGQIWVSRKQTKIAQAGVDLQRQVANLERAWMLVSQARLRSIGGRWEVLMAIRNGGRTPAFDVVVFAEWTHERPTEISGLVDDDIAAAPMVIGPGEKRDLWEKVVTPKAPIGFLNGFILYRDHAGTRRRTTFGMQFAVSDEAVGQYIGALNRAE